MKFAGMPEGIGAKNTTTRAEDEKHQMPTLSLIV